MPLHLDKRPSSLENFLGNEGIRDSLKSVLSRKQDIPHTFLFSGPSGCGKTTLARIAANMVGCHETSIIEYNSSNTRGIDTIRQISENAQMSALIGKNKAYILDEAHKLTNDAMNALLKILEDTPKHVFFFICTTDPNKLIKAIITRCMGFEVKSLPCPVLTKLIKETVKSEGIDDFPDSVVNAIVKVADGCPRQALILLDSVIDIVDEDAALKAVAESNLTETETMELCRLLLADRKNKWEDCRIILKGLPDDAEKIRYAVLGYMASVMIGDRTDGNTLKKASEVIDCFTESYIHVGKAGLYNSCYIACKL